MQLVVLFDGGCPMCRRTVRRIRALDWRHRLRFVDATDAAARERIAPGLTEAAVLIQMYVVDQHGARYAGFEAALQISRVVPLLWPVWLIARSPTATSKTGRCSSSRAGAPTIVLFSVM